MHANLGLLQAVGTGKPTAREKDPRAATIEHFFPPRLREGGAAETAGDVLRMRKVSFLGPRNLRRTFP